MIRTACAALAAAFLAVCGAAHAASFDGREPDEFAKALGDAGATDVKVKPMKEGEGHYIIATAVDGDITIGFKACGRRKQCQYVLMQARWDADSVTLHQLNAWNQWTINCPAYLDTDRSPFVWNTLTLYGDESRTRVAQLAKNYFGCVQDFDAFVGDPDQFLKDNLDDYQPEKAEKPAADEKPNKVEKSPG